ncbi:hypothetical protein LC593_11170 [Nostoc sp. CHAB 5844]|nr:hypothetical protein [Nostoc sp. CHAB 5844]
MVTITKVQLVTIFHPAIAIKQLKKIYQAVTTMTLNSYDEAALRVNLIAPDEISRYPQGLKLQAVAVCDR